MSIQSLFYEDLHTHVYFHNLSLNFLQEKVYYLIGLKMLFILKPDNLRQIINFLKYI